jgi:Phage integrase family
MTRSNPRLRPSGAQQRHFAQDLAAMGVEDLSIVCDNLCEIADQGVADERLDALEALAHASPPPRGAALPARVNAPTPSGQRVPPVRPSRRKHFTATDDLVFAGVAGGHLDGSALRKRFYGALDRAGLGAMRAKTEPITFHDLRHTFGTLAVQAFPLWDVKAYMGHADVQTTRVCVHHVPRHDAAAVGDRGGGDRNRARRRGSGGRESRLTFTSATAFRAQRQRNPGGLPSRTTADRPERACEARRSTRSLLFSGGVACFSSVAVGSPQSRCSHRSHGASTAHGDRSSGFVGSLPVHARPLRPTASTAPRRPRDVTCGNRKSWTLRRGPRTPFIVNR